jgi:tRNA(fMet)-specific endonuclease VapC
MLDTNTVSYILKDKSRAARTHLSTLPKGHLVCVSAITEAELLYGLAKSGSSERLRQAVDWFLAKLKVFPWGREEAAVYGAVRAKQEAMGKSLGALDMQIAAHAISLRAYLVTNDGAFRHVPDLAGVENWAIDLRS